jgi:beta-carotene 3-hydroxylase
VLCFLLVGALTLPAMEAWAAFVHRVLWHGPLYRLHRSHHGERQGRGWEHNDLFSLAHAAAALGLAWWARRLDGSASEALYGVAAGACLYGSAYALVHDGFIHRRLPLPKRLTRALRPLASAHRAHHRHGGAPYGLFASPWLLRRANERRRRAPKAS